MKKLPLFLAAMAVAAVAHADSYFVKEVMFPADADSVAKVEMASRVVPSPGQLAWQNLELTAFLHFGVNTFTDREWGDGKESPAIFNPVGLDASQWVKTLADAGFKMVILTAKHHDGFCLWPTATTSHSVKNSPWRNGKGDVVAELRKACDRYGMKLGLYLSPWDRNAECYGDSPRYNDMFVAQLTELLSNYGKVDEVWFDGACGEGPNGKKQEYDWERYKSVIRRLQPDAVVAIMGDDVRWVGNENGTGRLTEWSVTPKMPGSRKGAEEYNRKHKLADMAADIGSRAVVAQSESVRWWPSEVDVSIRPGWFFHDREDPKSLHDLAEIYLSSVGRNSVLLLNVPPDRQGRIHPSDSARLMELRRWIDANFSDNLIVRSNYSDLTFKLRKGATVNCVVLGEDIAKGQRVEQLEVMAKVNGRWQKVARATTVGYKRILTFAPVEASELRIDVKQSRGPVMLKSVAAYNVGMPEDVNESRPIKLYPRENYKTMSIGGKTVAVEALGAAFDGNDSTVWTSPSGLEEMSVVVDMGREVDVEGFVYTPCADGNARGTVFKYDFSLSDNAVEWNLGGRSGEFSNVVNNPIPQRVYLTQPVKARYFRFTCRGEVDARDFFSIAEFNIIEK